MTTEERMRIINEENLNDYVGIGIDTYEDLGEYSVLLNKVEEYYTLIIFGERCSKSHRVFPTMEEANYELIKYAREIKNDFKKYGYRPHCKTK